MKLLNDELIKLMEQYPLYSQDGKGENALIIFKFFLPIGAITWYITEGQKEENGDYTLFGYFVDNYFQSELSYFSLNEIEEIRLPYGLRVERDLYFSPTKVKDIEVLNR